MLTEDLLKGLSKTKIQRPVENLLKSLKGLIKAIERLLRDYQEAF
jgi:hypothetical protein